MRLTQQRAAILHLIDSSDHHWDAEAIAAALKHANHKIGIATVYRGLQALEQAGMLTTLQVEGRKHYERADKQHHDHRVCLLCGGIEEFCHPEIERLQLETAQQHGFVIQDHQLVLYGTCRACSQEKMRNNP
ncbi:MAG: transcriptional repressor [Mariprofundales bacterium]